MSKRYDILTCHPAKHHFYEQAYALSKEFNIRFLTSVFVPFGYVKAIAKVWPKLGSFLLKKTHRNLPFKYVVLHPLTELQIFWAKFMGKSYNYYTGNDQFGHWVVDNFEPPKIFIGVDTASGYIFKSWKGKSFLILDLVIALPMYRNKVYSEALATNPDADHQSFHFSTEPELSIYKEEIELADLILCGSEFVKNSCLDYGIPEERLKVIEYGADLELFKQNTSLIKSEEKFKLAFVGNFSVRKGSLLMIELMKRLAGKYPDIELHVFGKVADDIDKITIPATIFHGFLPQEIMKNELEKCHIMAFPTYFEGSAYSVYQSMSLGLPVITTPNCGSVVDELTGIVIPANSIDELEKAVLSLYNDREMVYNMGQRAAKKAQNYSWDDYGNKLTTLIKSLPVNLEKAKH